MIATLGYHGCDLPTAQQLLSGIDFVDSDKAYDWLGKGVYFWESDPQRALEWAIKQRKTHPCVVGAAIDLGNCLDLTNQRGLRAVAAAYTSYADLQNVRGVELSKNTDPRGHASGDLLLRRLDRDVIEHLYALQTEQGRRSPLKRFVPSFPKGSPSTKTPDSARKRTYRSVCGTTPASLASSGCQSGTANSLGYPTECTVEDSCFGRSGKAQNVPFRRIPSTRPHPPHTLPTIVCAAPTSPRTVSASMRPCTFNRLSAPFVPRHAAVLSLLLPLALPLALPGSAAAQAPPSDSTVQQFVNALLHKMTLAEKIGQMEQTAGQPMYTPPARAEELARTGGTGSFLFFTDPVRINELQHIAVTESRLHIPLIFGYDVIHGFRTIAPIPLAMAASWDPALVERTQAAAALEARAAGVQWAFAPMVDIARDARWGRIMESAGEDPVLGSAMAAAQVHGFQGPYPGSPQHILTSVKHFAGYGAVEGGRDYDSVDLSDEQLHNVCLRPYKAAVDAGSAIVMSAYTDLNGVPATGNTWLLTDVLRKEWGFKGFVVSDWNSVADLETHGFAASPADAAVRAANAGVNMEMTSATYRQFLPAAVAQGKVSLLTIDDLVRPILAAKYRLGLFTNPYADMANFRKVTGSPEERAAVRSAATQTAVLLRNEAHALPLRKDLKSIAVIGPLADSKLDTLGSWAIHGDRDNVVTVAQGIREKLPNAQVAVTTGVEIERGSPTIFDEQVPPAKPTLTTPEARETEFQHALSLARAADVAVLVLGEAQTMNGERASRASLTLPGEQQRLLEAVTALGKPVVLVLMTGRPLDLNWASRNVPAILNIWYPGSEGGHAVADLLFGDSNPSGHLPVTWPRSAGQEPLFYSSNLTQIPDDTEHRYWDLPSSPLYTFGYGLSYSDFSFSNLQLTSPQVNSSTPLRLRVTLRNTAAVPGADVVQLYTHQRAGSASRPVRELKAFRKVSVAANGTQDVELTVPAQELSFWSPALGKQVLEPGTFDVWVGDSSSAALHTTFQVTAPQP